MDGRPPRRHRLPRRERAELRRTRTNRAVAWAMAIVMALSSLLTGIGPWAAAVAAAATRPAGAGVTTIDQALGCTRTVEETLAAHEGDGYYLGTPYGNTGPGTGGPVDQWSCRYPNGRPNPGTGTAYMNCAGFVSAVITDAGGDVSAIAGYVNPDTGYRRGNDTNASKWQGWTEHNAVEMYEFGTKEEMLASGVLQRGDIIYMHPFSFEGDDDAHIGFFWGSTSSEDLFWHSSSHGDGLVAGSQPGNMISRITPKSPVKYYRVIKVRHDVEINFRKVAENAGQVDISSPYYSMRGAVYEIHRADNDALVTTLTLDADGRAKATLDPNTVYYAVETKAPAGFTLNPDRITFNSMGGNHAEDAVELPEQARPPVTFQKVSSLPGVDTSGAGYSLAGAVYEIHRADDDALVQTITTDASGRATIHLDAGTDYYAVETKAPAGFTLNPNRISFNSANGKTVELPDAPRVTVTVEKVSSSAGVDTSDPYYSFAGAVYEIRLASTGALVDTVTTGRNGRATATLEANTDYYLVETKAPAGFTLNPDRISFNSGSGKTVKAPDAPHVTVTFTKVSADASITAGNAEYAYAGATYDIYLGKSPNGTKVATITTDERGHADLKLEPNEDYYAVETKAPQGFIRNPDPISFRTGNKDGAESLADDPGTVRITVRKKDSATGGAAQAGATLEGAEYRITDANGSVHTATTDANGSIVIRNLPFGDLTVVETKSPKGYKLDTTVHRYHISSTQMTASGEYELEPEDDFIENPVAFDIDIVKYRDTGADGSGLQDPAPGVRFQIISNTTGTVVGTIETDANGYATTAGRWLGSGSRNEGIAGALPYDAKGYTVREDPASTPEGYQPAGDWSIGPEQMVDGATLHYIVDNDFVSTHLQVVKVDAETGRTVPAAGFTFQLLDERKKPITQEAWYPNHVELSEFTTDETGKVTFPEALRPGTYYVREVAVGCAPYLTGTEDVRVVIPNDPDAAPVAAVTYADSQAKGDATIRKACAAPDGSSASHVHDEGCAGDLAGAEFDVVAREDVVSPDGTVRALAGQVVGHVATGEDGTATIEGLYLGNGEATYAFVETVPPAGHVLDPEPHEFTLSYEDGATATVTARAEAQDEPTETVVDKTVLGYEDSLPGAAFLLWNADDEVAVEAEEGKAALAIDAPEGGEATATPVVGHAEIEATLPDGWSAALIAEGGREVDASEADAIEPGAWRLAVTDGDGEAVDVGLDEVEAEAGRSYALVVRDSFFFGASASFDDRGAIAEPVEITYDADRGALVATGLEAGRYTVALGGGEAEVDLAQGTATVLDGDLRPIPALVSDGGASRLVTDADGKLVIRHLVEGSYRLWEVDAPDGFVADGAVRYFTVDRDGMTEGFESYALPIADDFTKVDLSKRAVATEDEVPGAHLAVIDADGETVDEWTSGEEPHRIEALAPGDYTLVEVKTPHGYDEASSVAFTVEETGEVQTVVMYDEPIDVSGEVDKRQEIADPTHPYTDADATADEGGANNAPVTEGPDGSFDYSVDFRSTSSTWVDEFTVTDEIQAAEDGLATLEGIATPVAGEDYDGLLNVWYRTNMTDDGYADPSGANATLSDGHENPWLTDPATADRLGDDGRAVSYDGWRLWAAGVSATEATELGVADLGLAEGEAVTAVRLEYGRVEAGFTSRPDDGGWERDLLKDAHDDVADVAYGGDGAEGSPLVLHMRATDWYRDGEAMRNGAAVELYRNGGDLEPDEGLEDRDDDRVEQSPVERLPEIGTVLVDDADGDHVAEPERVTLTDTVSYTGLEPGVEHTLHGALMDRDTGEPALGADGQAVTAETTFTPEGPDGSADVTFELDAGHLNGRRLVAFEELTIEEDEKRVDEGTGETVVAKVAKAVAEHRALEDDGQTVSVPPIEISGEIDKRQEIADPTHPYTDADATADEGGANNAAVSLSDDGSYDYAIDFRSTSSTWVDEFTVTDEIQAAEDGLAELTGITTPVAWRDYDGLLNVWYRTNMTEEDYVDPSGANATLSDGHENPWLEGSGRRVPYDGWRLWAAGVSATEATELGVSDLGLAEGEAVTAVRFEYGRVERGFTTRKDGGDWERDLLKDAHDDVADASALEGGGIGIGSVYRYEGTWATAAELGSRGIAIEDADGATALIVPTGDGGTERVELGDGDVQRIELGLSGAVAHMRVTDAYRDGCALENGAEVDLYRTAGEDVHEDHDDDRVEQSPVERLPEIGTALTDADEGDHAIEAGAFELTDTVSYTGLETGVPHILRGTLMDRETGEPVEDAGGDPVTAEAAFTPDEPDGEAEVSFSVDAAALGGTDLVAFERLYWVDAATGEEVPAAAHEDIDDDGQTVSVGAPEIGTTLTDASDGDHVTGLGKVELTDTVEYRGLAAGQGHVVRGTLMDRATGEPVEDAGGDPVTAEAAFTPDEPDGEVEVSFSVDTASLEGHELVAFEEVAWTGGGDGPGTVVATHEDLGDENQTVRPEAPSIGTTLTDDADGDHLVAPGPVELTDTVSYRGLTVGQEHTLHGTLVDRETGEAVEDAGGDPVTAEAAFIPEETDGAAEVSFEFDASGLDGRDLVAFETLTVETERQRADAETGAPAIERLDEVVASHEDLGDRDQTVIVRSAPTPLEVLDRTGAGPVAAALAAAAAALGAGAFALLRRRRDRFGGDPDGAGSER